MALSLRVDTPRMRALAKRIELNIIVKSSGDNTLSIDSCRRDAISLLYGGIIVFYGERYKLGGGNEGN